MQALGVPACVYIDDTILAGRSKTIGYDQYLTRLFYALVHQPTAGAKSEDSTIKRLMIALGVSYHLAPNHFCMLPKETILFKIQRLGEKIINATQETRGTGELALDDLRKLLGTAVAASPLALSWMGANILSTLHEWNDDKNFKRMTSVRKCRRELNTAVRRLLATWTTLCEQQFSRESPTCKDASDGIATLIYYSGRSAIAVETTPEGTRITQNVEIATEYQTDEDARWALAFVLDRISPKPLRRGIILHPTVKPPKPRKSSRGDPDQDAVDPIWIAATLTMGGRPENGIWINRYTIEKAVAIVKNEVNKRTPPERLMIHPSQSLQNTAAYKLALGISKDDIDIPLLKKVKRA